MNVVKINSDYFFVEDFSTQFSIGSHGTINLTINTFKYPEYYKFFTDIFDNYYDKSGLSKSDFTFNIQLKNLRAYGCLIKSLDIDSMNYLLYVNINCDYLEQVTVQEKREEIITDLLNDSTSQNKNNIN
jgi:hypothetical protein